MSKIVQKLSFTLLLVSFLAASSCKKKDEVKPLPTVDFTFNPVNPVAPAAVTFSNLSQNATSYSWDFGNGQTSNQQNPSVTFTTGGTFNVTLTATGDGGSNKITKPITVIGPPVADFSFSPTSARAPIVINFTNSSQNATSYSWDFGNGQTSTLQNPTATYSNGGTFTVTLTATGQGGLTNKITKTLTIQAPYTRVGITELIILDYPPTKTTGENWDPAVNGTFPDIYFDITRSGTTTNLFSIGIGNRLENLRNADLPFGWVSTTGNPFYTHTNLSQAIDVDLYDYDSVGSNEYMGTAAFDFRNYATVTNPYPQFVTITNGRVSIRLKLIWQ